MKAAGNLSNITFTAFDIETTGLTPVVDRIVEIGAVRFCGNQVIDTFDALVDPLRPISPGASSVNGITDEMVQRKPTIEKVLPRFLEFLGDAVPVAHHAPFDVGFLAYEISRLNLPALDNPVLDTCVIPKRLFPYAGSYSLENLAGFLGIKSETFHRALADSLVCMKILNRCVVEMGGLERVSLSEILEMNGPSVSLCSGGIVLDKSCHPLQAAIENGNEMEITYRDARGALSARTITPLSLGVSRGAVMMEAFCHLRKGKRNFRLDRIVGIR
jgi:DNA polymerase III subunit epsilon